MPLAWETRKSRCVTYNFQSTMEDARSKRHTFIVEHLDPELEAWQALEYKSIYQECKDSGASFILSGVANAAAVQRQLELPSHSVQQQGIEDLYSTPEARRKVCLLDPKGERDISPEDGGLFDVFLFGGILGDDPPRGIRYAL